jgi:anti-sigma factor RsiW
VKYQNEQLRDALSAEYALGTLQGRARRRFERSLKDDPQLRRLVAQWQGRLAPLDALVEPTQPPARVWQAIQDRIQAGSRRQAFGAPRSFWASLGFWRGAAIASATVAVALAVWLAVIPPSTSASSSANVCPEPASSLSACAGFIVAENCCPNVPEAPSSSMVGFNRARVERAQGMSMFFGFGTAITPIAPALCIAFQRSDRNE